MNCAGRVAALLGLTIPVLCCDAVQAEDDPFTPFQLIHVRVKEKDADQEKVALAEFEEAELEEIIQPSGLLGQHYISATFDVMWVGDEGLQRIGKTAFGATFETNDPVTDHLDLHTVFGFSGLEGDIWASQLGPIVGMDFPVEVDMFEARFLFGGTYHWLPEEQVDPFLRAEVGIWRGEVSYSAPSIGIPTYHVEETGTKTLFRVVAGVEYDLSEVTTIRPAFTWEDVAEEGYDSQFYLGVGMSHWFNDKFLGRAELSYELTDGDILLNVGAGVRY